MTYIAGWQASDLGALSNTTAVVNPDQIKQVGPSGGFLVPGGSTVENVVFAASASRNVRFYIYAVTDDSLLAQTPEYTTAGTGAEESFALSAAWSPASDTYVWIAPHSDGYLGADSEESSLRSMALDNTAFANGPTDPFVSVRGDSSPRTVIYLDGQEASTAPTITSVTDSVGGTADRVTSGATVDIALDSAIGTQGSSTVTLTDSTGTYSESGTINTWDDTNDIITATCNQSGMRFGDTDNELTVTLDDGTTVTATGITFAAPSGTYWVNGSSPDTTSQNSAFYNALTPPTAGYQLIWRDPNDVGGTSSDPGGDQSASLFDSTGLNDDIARPGKVPIRAWDDSDGTTSAEVTYTATLESVASVIAGLKFGVRNSVRKSATMAVYDSVSKGMQ